MNDYNSRYEHYLTTFETYAKAYADKLTTKPQVLGESMKYSLLSGGDRKSVV